MIRPARILATTLLVAPLAAQGFTSPRGLGGVEGDASHFALFNPGYERFMQIDDTQTGHAAAGIRGIAFRRDGDAVTPYGTARTVDLTIRVGTADYGAATGTFASDWSGTPTTVFTRKPVNVPDWSQLAAVRPAPFDLTLPLDVTYAYGGARALAFELVMENTNGILSPDVDAERGTAGAFTQAVGRAFDFGCLVAGQRVEMGHTFDVENYGPGHALHGIRLGFAVQRGPLLQPAVVNIDLSDPALTVPGLCGTVHALPNIALPLGATDAAGNVARVWVDVPYSTAFEQLHLFTQALALDPQGFGVPIALSERRDAVIPDAPRTSPRCSYAYAALANTPSARLWRDRGVVVRFLR